MEVFGIFLSPLATHLWKRADSLATKCQSTIMSSTTPHRSDNDGPQPRLVIGSMHDVGIWTLAYLPDGRRIVTGSGDGDVKVLNMENGRQEWKSIEHGRGIRGLAVTRDGTKIISSDDAGEIKVWDAEAYEIVKEWTHSEGYPVLAISPDDRLIAVGDRPVAIYTMEGRQVINSIEVGSLVLSMCFSPNGKKLACSTNHDIRVYDVDDRTLIQGPLEGHQDSVFDVLWSRDGSRLFSGSDDETIRCWNSDTGEQIGHPWIGHTGPIRSLSLSPDGSILASASWDKTVRLWGTTTGSPIGQQHLQHDEQVDAVRFSPSGEFVVSVGGGKIYLWRVPYLNSVENRVRALIKCTSVFRLVTLTI